MQKSLEAHVEVLQLKDTDFAQMTENRKKSMRKSLCQKVTEAMLQTDQEPSGVE